MLTLPIGDADPTYETVAELVYCQAVISEALRLYPPAPLTVRTLTEDMSLEGHSLPAGTMVYMPIWWVHRYKPNWGDDADLFRPERHLDGGLRGSGKSASSFRQIAFSGGKRNCVGQRFAMIESTVLFVSLIRSLKFNLAPGCTELKSVSSGVVQKPANGELWLRASPR